MTLADAIRLTPLERDLMEHALGRDYPNKERDFRNHYVIGEECADIAVWRSLVARGMASEQPYSLAQGSFLFRVTDVGKLALDAKVEQTAPHGEGM